MQEIYVYVCASTYTVITWLLKNRKTDKQTKNTLWYNQTKVLIKMGKTKLSNRHAFWENSEQLSKT